MRDGWNMAAFRARDVPRCCGCLTVRSVSLGLALYVMFFSCMFLVLTIMEVAHGVNLSLPNVLLSFSSGLLILLAGIGLMYGVLRSIPGLLLPFISFQVLDITISVLSFCGLFVRFPPCFNFLNVQRNRAAAWLEVDGAPGEDASEKHLLRPIVYLALAAAALVLLKLYLLQCVLRCYKYIKSCRSEERKVHISAVTLPEKGILLPSYEEAVALPAKEPPPPAYYV